MDKIIEIGAIRTIMVYEFKIEPRDVVSDQNTAVAEFEKIRHNLFCLGRVCNHLFRYTRKVDNLFRQLSFG